MATFTSRIRSTAACAWFSSSLLAGCSASVVDQRPPPDPCPRGVICTIAGTAFSGLTGDGGPATEAALDHPMDYAIGPDGNGYVVDWNSHRIRRIDKATHTIETFAGTDDWGEGPAGPATKTHFNHPTNIVFDPESRMLIAAWHNSKIKTVDLDGNISDTCGDGKRWYDGDGGPAKLASFDLPNALAVAADGTLYVMDQANQVIRAVDPSGIIRKFAGTCIVNSCAAGELPEKCETGNKLVCNKAMNAEMCKAPGVGCAGAFSDDGGPAADLRMAQPASDGAAPGGRLAFDGHGDLYFADYGNHRVRKIDMATRIVTTVAGNGTAGAAGDGGKATDAQLNRPTDIAFGPDGAMYVADTFNDCIRRVAGGLITTVVGQCGKSGFAGDGGDPTEALLKRPYGVEVAPNGDLYITDTQNNRIRKVRH